MPSEQSSPAFEWPQIFDHPRKLLDTEAPDRPYLAGIRESGIISGDSDEESNSDDSESDSDDDDNAEENANAPLPQVSAGNGSQDTNTNPEDALQESESTHPVRQFMRPAIIGNGMGNQRLDQESVVSRFCEHAAQQARTERPRQESDFIAIVDIRSNVGVPLNGVGRGVPKQQWGGLTPCQLSEELGIKEFPAPVAKKGKGGRSVKVANFSADRVLVYLPNLSEPGMTVLAECAYPRERAAMAKFLYDHMKFDPSVDVHITARGFRTFAFHLNLPFIAFRKHRKLRRDSRVRPDGETFDTLRRSWTASCLMGPSSAKEDAKLPCFYEAQASVMLFGIEDRIYKAYGTVDTYYLLRSELLASVKTHHKDWTESSRMWDPLSRQTEINDPIWESRHYFLSIWAENLAQISTEWDTVTGVMKDAVKKRRLAPPETKSHVKELNDWTEEMLRLLSQFITLLSETTQAWEEFEKCDLGYFISDKNKERSPYRQKIQKSYSGLRLKLKSLQNLKVELIENNRHQITSHFGLLTYDAAVKVLGLTVIAFCFSAFTQVTGMFNMQNGVLPFEANPRTFTGCLFGFIFLYLVACYLNFTWEEKWGSLFFAKLTGSLTATPNASPSKPAANSAPAKSQEPVGNTQDMELEDRGLRGIAARIRPRSVEEDVERGTPQ